MLIGVAGLLVNWFYKHKLTLAEIRLKEGQVATIKGVQPIQFNY